MNLLFLIAILLSAGVMLARASALQPRKARVRIKR
jgi:hypothetical protein